MQSGDPIFIWQMIWININEFEPNQTINPNNGGKNTDLVDGPAILHYQTMAKEQGTSGPLASSHIQLTYCEAVAQVK